MVVVNISAEKPSMEIIFKKYFFAIQFASNTTKTLTATAS